MTEAQAADFFKEKFSLKAFLQGLAAALLVYLLLFGWAFVSADKTRQTRQEKLASQTVIVDWPEGVANITTSAPPEGVGAEEIPRGPGEVQQPSVSEQPPPPPAQKLASGLTEAPVNGLFEVTKDGNRLPVIRSRDGLTPFKAYQRPFDAHAAHNRPIIAVGIAGLGLSDLALESALRSMPGEVSFIFSPYAPSPDFWIRESRARGHEVWMSLPVEPENYPVADPGPHTLLIGAPERENQLKLEWVMGRTDGYVGFVTNPQPVFMKSANDMRPVVGNIYHRGLGLIDGSTDPGTIPQAMAAGMKAPYGAVDVWIDRHTATEEGLGAALKRLEETASEQGFAIGIIHTLPVSYQELLDWLGTLSQKGYVLAPLSATAGF